MMEIIEGFLKGIWIAGKTPADLIKDLYNYCKGNAFLCIGLDIQVLSIVRYLLSTHHNSLPLKICTLDWIDRKSFN